MRRPRLIALGCSLESRCANGALNLRFDLTGDPFSMNIGTSIQRPEHVPAERVFDIDVYSPPGLQDGYHAAWARLFAAGVPDLVWTPRNGGHWVATRATVIERVYAEHQHFSNHVMLVPKLLRPDGKDVHYIVPSYLDPPEHGPYRELLTRAFAPRSIGALESRIREIAIALITAVRAQGQCDFIQAYANVLPIQVFMSLVDLPLSDVPKVKAWVEVITKPEAAWSIEARQERTAGAQRSLHEYLDPYISARLGHAGEDMLSRLVNGQVHGRALTRPEMRDMCTQIMFGGLDTVANFLGFVLLFLAGNPQHRRELLANPALIPAAVEELLRRFPVVTVGREVRHDMQFEGVTLKAGEMIMAPTPLSGLDERVNADPLAVDFHRQGGQHTAFGRGIHRCPGAHLGRMEVAITIREWLARIPEFSVTADTQLVYAGGVVGRIAALPLVWDPATPKQAPALGAACGD